MKNVIISIVLILSLCGAAMADISTPVSYWALNETSGTTVHDSADSHNGTIGGNPVWSSAGKVGGCLDFDGNGDNVNFGNVSAFNFGSSNFTISCWFKTEGTHDIGSGGGTGHGMLLSKYDAFGSRQWFIEQEDGGKIDFVTFKTNTTAGAENVGSTNSYFNVWTHVAAVRNGSTKYLYINGQLDNTGVCSGIISGTADVLMGALPDYSCYQTFNGKIDDMRVYNYALSANEVAQLYVPEPATICLFALAGLFIRGKK